MSLEYDLYLNEHRLNVMRAFDWLCKNVYIKPDKYVKYKLKHAAKNIVKHDESKYSEYEYEKYDRYFYPVEGEDNSNADVLLNYAWLHHIHENKHHWQHYVLFNDDPEMGAIALKMPIQYVIEMVCDWWSFGWKDNNKYKVFKWYERNKDHIIIHEETRKYVEDLLGAIRYKLNHHEDGYNDNIRALNHIKDAEDDNEEEDDDVILEAMLTKGGHGFV